MGPPFLSHSAAYSRTFFANQSDGSFASANLVAPIVVDLLSPQSVVDVGCGVGTWLRVFREQGCTRLLGFDGEWVPRDKFMVDSSTFHSVDLTNPPVPNERFDLAICVEVAEHLPTRSSKALIDFVTGLSDFVIWSSAIPHQGGPGHINEQFPDFWYQHFAVNNYVCFDLFRARFWSNPTMMWWYAQNLLFYVHRSQAVEISNKTGIHPFSDGPPPCFVHPQRYMKLATSIEYPHLISPFKLFRAAIKSTILQIRNPRKHTDR